jgi:hypothetical protein
LATTDRPNTDSAIASATEGDDDAPALGASGDIAASIATAAKSATATMCRLRTNMWKPFFLDNNEMFVFDH